MRRSWEERRAEQAHGREERAELVTQALADLRELVRLLGSALRVGVETGLGERQVGRWLCGHTQPKPASCQHIRDTLEAVRSSAGDPAPLRKARLLRYQRRAAAQLPLFAEERG